MQGQSVVLVDGEMKAKPEIEQRVVIARDDAAAMKLINELSREFKVIGYATLKEYEATVAKLRATLNGVDTGWKMIVEPGLN